jgi:hypothetical protein
MCSFCRNDLKSYDIANDHKERTGHSKIWEKCICGILENEWILQLQLRSYSCNPRIHSFSIWQDPSEAKVGRIKVPERGTKCRTEVIGGCPPVAEDKVRGDEEVPAPSPEFSVGAKHTGSGEWTWNLLHHCRRPLQAQELSNGYHVPGKLVADVQPRTKNLASPGLIRTRNLIAEIQRALRGYRPAIHWRN